MGTNLKNTFPRMYENPWDGVEISKNLQLIEGKLLRPREYYCVEYTHDIFKILLAQNKISELPTGQLKIGTPFLDKYVIMYRDDVQYIIKDFEDRCNKEEDEEFEDSMKSCDFSDSD
jgi:hypothetical protein